MAPPRLEAVVLADFKTFRLVDMPLDEVTVLTGRNGSGKSNALDALDVLSRMASGDELSDALDGRGRDGGGVRGGSRGCAPHGTDRFSLGCRVRTDTGVFTYYVTVQVEPELRVVHEELFGPAPALKSGRVSERALVWTHEAPAQSTAIVAEVHNGKRGTNPQYSFRDTRMLLPQLLLRIDPSTAAEEAVLDAAEAVTGALRGVFHLDPVPHLMRGYVPERDDELRRTGENLSAAVMRLRRDDPDAFERLRTLVAEVADHRIDDIDVEASRMGDVMLGIVEGDELTPAREMSDGILRIMAMAVALLARNRDLDIAPSLAPQDVAAAVLLVVEELENGLHPSQADLVLRLLREAGTRAAKRVLITTHSPALLNVMTGELNNSVLVCFRDPSSGRSSISRMTELPGYVDALAGGQLGDNITRDRLTRPQLRNADDAAFRRLLGIDLPA